MMTVQMPDGVSHGGSAVLQSPSGFVPPSSKGMDKFMELYYEDQHSNASHSDGSGDEEDDGDSNNMQVRPKMIRQPCSTAASTASPPSL